MDADAAVTALREYLEEEVPGLAAELSEDEYRQLVVGRHHTKPRLLNATYQSLRDADLAPGTASLIVNLLHPGMCP
jgi:hypothetical protein